MKFPDDLPEIMFYRVGSTSRTCLPRRPVVYVSSSGKTDAPRPIKGPREMARRGDEHYGDLE